MKGPDPTFESRYVSASPKLALGPNAIRARADGSTPRLVGFAAVYNSDGYPLRSNRKYVEVIARGAFDRTLRDNPDVRALWNGDASKILGRVSSGTLILKQHKLGLLYDIALADTDAGKDVAELVARKDVTGSSLGFNVVEAEYSSRTGGVCVCTILDVDLFYVGPATFPEFEETQLELIRSRLARAKTESGRVAGRAIRIRYARHSEASA